MATLSQLVQKLKKLKDQKNELQEALNKLNAQIDNMECKTVPEAMAQAGVLEFTTSDGKLKVVSKFDFFGGLPAPSTIEKSKGDERNVLVKRLQDSLAWLRAHGHADLIKNEIAVSLPKESDNVAAAVTSFLDENDLSYIRYETVHPQTFRAWLREQNKAGVDVPLDLFGVVGREKATLKEL